MIKKIILLLLCSLAIVMMLPRNAVIETQFEIGNVWEHPTIYAPYNIPIIKTTEQLKSDEVLLIENYKPLFRLNTKQVVTNDTLIENIYSRGVLSKEYYDTYKGRIIRVINGSIMKELPVSQLYNPHSAKEFYYNTKLSYNKRFYPSRASFRNSSKEQETFIPNLYYDDKLNAISSEEFISQNSLTRGVIKTGDVIISNGQIIDVFSVQALKSYYSVYQDSVQTRTISFLILGAKLFIVILILILNIIFFQRFSTFYFGKILKPLLFIFIMYVIMAGLVSVARNVLYVNPLIVPLPIVSIYLLTFFNMRVAILGNISVAIICSLFTVSPFSFFVINFMAGMVSIIMMRNMYHRVDLFKTVGVIFLVEILLFISLEFISGTTLTDVSLFYVGLIAINNFLILAFYQAIYLIEKIFGFVSDLTLLELSDTNQKLLLSLAHQSPGTFQHSVQVANLAESAASTIGARALLARCGAMYHDIGKMKNSFYFIENLTGNFNPHNDLTPFQSVEIIKSHVSDGIEVAKRGNLPLPIINFIEQHHGNSLIYYFYAKVKDDENVDENLFHYPGQNPVGKEVSICMMADAVEAASRSLDSYDKDRLDGLVEKIINAQITEGLLVNSELSFAEVVVIKSVFKQKLYTIYHGRIAYPSKS